MTKVFNDASFEIKEIDTKEVYERRFDDAKSSLEELAGNNPHVLEIPLYDGACKLFLLPCIKNTPNGSVRIMKFAYFEEDEKGKFFTWINTMHTLSFSNILKGYIEKNTDDRNTFQDFVYDLLEKNSPAFHTVERSLDKMNELIGIANNPVNIDPGVIFKVSDSGILEILLSE